MQVGTLRSIACDAARPSKELAACLGHALGITDAAVGGVVACVRGGGDPPLGPLPALQDDTLSGQASNVHSAHATLPAQLTALIGRTHEVAAVGQLDVTQWSADPSDHH